MILKLKLIWAGDAGAGAGEIAILKIETVAPLGRAPKIGSLGDLLGWALEVAPLWQLQKGALLRTPKLARDSVKVSNPMCRVSVFHGRVMHKFAL